MHRQPEAAGGSRQLRWSAGLGVRADPYCRYQVCGFQPGHPLVLTLQDYENEGRRIDRHREDAMTGCAEHTATAVRLLRRSCSRIGRGRHHFRADRSRGHRVRDRIGNKAKCRDRREHLHQQRQHYDWNEFQPSSHNCPQNALLFTIRLEACRDCLPGHVRNNAAKAESQVAGRAARCEVGGDALSAPASSCRKDAFAGLSAAADPWAFQGNEIHRRAASVPETGARTGWRPSAR